MFGWFRNRGSLAFDPAWVDLLQAGVWQYKHLDERQRERVHSVVARFVARKEWVGAGGQEITDEVRVTIAGAASLLTLGLDEPYDFPRLKSIIVYPGTFQAPVETGDITLLGSDDPILGGGPRLGEAWPRSPIVLSWRSAQRQARMQGRGRNLVLHEFAHHVDGLSGDMDGVPHFDSPDDLQRWFEVTDNEYHALVGNAQRRVPTLLNVYGATNLAEFFAVVVECFFERAHAMRRRHAELYELMCLVFRQDPTEWLPAEADDTAPQHPGAAVARAGREKSRRDLVGDLSELDLTETDQRFSRAAMLLDWKQAEEAEQLLTEVLAATPDDSEALQLRGEARLMQQDFQGAAVDAAAVLAIDPDEPYATLVLAESHLAVGEDQQAAKLVQRAHKELAESPWAWRLAGRLRYRSGDFDKAVQCYRRSVWANAWDAEAHLGLAAALEALGRKEEANTHRDRAENLEPDLAENPPVL